MLKIFTRHKNPANSLAQEQLTEQDKKYLTDNNLKSSSQDRGNRTDASIDKITECRLTRANTFTEDTARLNFNKGLIKTIPFSLFRGVYLIKSDIDLMLKAKSTFTFLVSNSGNTHSTCYAPVAKDFAKYKYRHKKKAVVFIIPPNSISLKNGWVNIISYNAFLLENTECHNVPIAKSWKANGIYYMELAPLSQSNLAD